MGVKIVGRLGTFERYALIWVFAFSLMGCLLVIPGVFHTYFGIIHEGGGTPEARYYASTALLAGIGLTMIVIGCIIAIIWLLKGGKR